LLAQESANLYNFEKELALGRHVAAEIRRQSKPLENADVAGYASRIGTRLVSHLAESPRFPYSFGVIIDAGMTEPIALPGNHILIPAGFFLAGQDESEFAVMLAYTIGHSIFRQGERANRPVDTANLASIPLISMNGWIGSHADSRATTQMPLAFLKLQRSYELEADLFGLELAARAGYDAAAFRRYIDRIQPADSDMSFLPARESRLAHIDEFLSAVQASPSPATGEFESIQRAVRKELGQPERRRTPTLRR
jgi:predicted Zn-dependent protease